jgi:hypothetical protein
MTWTTISSRVVIKALTVLTAVLAGCYGPAAPNNVLGTYRGVVTGGGTCPSPAADLTVTISKYEAFGDWYPEQQNIHTQFACAWVNQIGFFSSRLPPQGGMEYVIGYFTHDGSALDARIDAGTCSYTGRISRASPNDAARSSASLNDEQQLGESFSDHRERHCGDHRTANADASVMATRSSLPQLRFR